MAADNFCPWPGNAAREKWGLSPLPVMAHFEAFFDEPLEFSEAVDDCIRLVWVRRGAGEDLVDPGVFPTDTVKKD